jgi:hypothetical protein
MINAVRFIGDLPHLDLAARKIGPQIAPGQEKISARA